MKIKTEQYHERLKQIAQTISETLTEDSHYYRSNQLDVLQTEAAWTVAGAIRISLERYLGYELSLLHIWDSWLEYHRLINGGTISANMLHQMYDINYATAKIALSEEDLQMPMDLRDMHYFMYMMQIYKATALTLYTSEDEKYLEWLNHLYDIQGYLIDLGYDVPTQVIDCMEEFMQIDIATELETLLVEEGEPE